MYLAGVESFVNSQESVPLSFTGKTTQLPLKKKNNSCVRATHFPTLLNQMNPTYSKCLMPLGTKKKGQLL